MSDKCGIVIDFLKVLQSELKKSMSPDCFETAMECTERAFKEFCFNAKDLSND
jgi:hypothetical protein